MISTRKKLVFTIIVVLTALVVIWLAYRSNAPYPDDPFVGVSEEDFVEIDLLKGTSVIAVLTEEECAKLIPLLLQVELYGQPKKIDPVEWGGGVSRMFRITLTGKDPFDFSDFGNSYLQNGESSFSKHHNYELGQSIGDIYAELYFQHTGHSHVG